MTGTLKEAELCNSARILFDTYVGNGRKNPVVTLYQEDFDYLNEKGHLKPKGKRILLDSLIPVVRGHKKEVQHRKAGP